METIILNESKSVLSSFIIQLRDRQIQTDSMRFRRNLERIGEYFAIEISKTLNYKELDVKTPLGVATESVCSDKLVLTTILRAGIPFHQGFLSIFDDAENGFISAYRKYNEDGDFDIHLEYVSMPELSGKVVVLCDPMLASGSSMVLAYKALKRLGNPKQVHLATIIASQDGIDYVENNIYDDEVTLWIGALDDELNAKSFIVPGLGDVGDLAFGKKMG